MNISRNTIIIACTVALALLIVIVVVLVVIETPSKRDKPAIFKRCDGLSDPIDQIEISTCPDSAEVGYCEFDFNKNITIKLSFTPGKMRCSFNYALFQLKASAYFIN